MEGQVDLGVGYILRWFGCSLEGVRVKLWLAWCRWVQGQHFQGQGQRSSWPKTKAFT